MIIFPAKLNERGKRNKYNATRSVCKRVTEMSENLNYKKLIAFVMKVYVKCYLFCHFYFLRAFGNKEINDVKNSLA